VSQMGRWTRPATPAKAPCRSPGDKGVGKETRGLGMYGVIWKLQ
jgi:hypothetical protein